MKNVKLLLVSLFFCFSFLACEDEKLKGLLPPAAEFNFTPVEPVEGKEMLFYADPSEGSGKITEWNWSFGDANNSTSNKRNPYFTYTKAGTYDVQLVVKNEAGETFETSKSVVVAPPPKELIANIVWEFSNNTTVANENEGSNAPVIGDDGTIYYVEGGAGADSKLVAVTDKGTTAQFKWAAAPGNRIQNAPSMGPDGNLYINSWLPKSLFKVNSANGNILWNANTVTQTSNNTVAIDANGNLYHGTRSNSKGGIFSWAPDGTKRWEIVGVGAFYAAPAISKDGSTVYYLNTDTGKIWAVKSADGSQKWTSPVGLDDGEPGPNVSVGGDGTIYFTTKTHVAAVTDAGTTGSLKWSTPATNPAHSGVVIGPKGDLYVGSATGLMSLNPADGSVNWTYNTSISESVPAVDVDGNIYVGTTDGKMIVVSPKGILLKEFDLGNDVVNSPTIANDGTVYIEALDGSVIKLYKIAVKEGGPAKSAWPMKGQNVKNTGMVK